MLKDFYEKLNGSKVIYNVVTKSLTDAIVTVETLDGEFVDYVVNMSTAAPTPAPSSLHGLHAHSPHPLTS